MAKMTERQRILAIIKSVIGCTAIDSDTPEEVGIDFFRELYTTIEYEINK